MTRLRRRAASALAAAAGLALLGASVPAGAQTLAWSVVPSPNAAVAGDSLGGVSCVQAAGCTAAGAKVYVRGDAEFPRTLIASGAPSSKSQKISIGSPL